MYYYGFAKKNEGVNFLAQDDVDAPTLTRMIRQTMSGRPPPAPKRPVLARTQVIKEVSGKFTKKNQQLGTKKLKRRPNFNSIRFFHNQVNGLNQSVAARPLPKIRRGRKSSKPRWVRCYQCCCQCRCQCWCQSMPMSISIRQKCGMWSVIENNHNNEVGVPVIDQDAEWEKVCSRLSAHLQPFFPAPIAYFRQKNMVFWLVATKESLI